MFWTRWVHHNIAVRLQIDVALIAVMLLRIPHDTAARTRKISTALLLARLKTRLGVRLDLRRRTTPPPRPPDPQFRLVFQ